MHQLISEALASRLRESADALIELEMQRLDLLQSAVWSKAVAGDTFAVASVLRIMERRARLAGIDAPVKASIETGPLAIRLEVEEAAAEFDRKLAMRLASLADAPAGTA